MTLPDESFDRVLASHVISTVANPAKVVEECWRVCRPGGTVVLLNHFRSRTRLASFSERLLTPLTRRIGFVLDLSLESLLDGGLFTPEMIEKVNVPPLWSLVRLRRHPQERRCPSAEAIDGKALLPRHGDHPLGLLTPGVGHDEDRVEAGEALTRERTLVG